MGTNNGRKFYFIELDISDLSCPLCKKILCVNGINCDIEKCNNHHAKEHVDSTGENVLYNYLKSEYNENSTSPNYQNLLISYIIEDEELHNLLISYIQDYSKRLTRINPKRPHKMREEASKILLLAYELNLDKEILDTFLVKHQGSDKWPKIYQSSLEKKIDELIESPPIDFDQKIKTKLLKIFNLETVIEPDFIDNQIIKIINNYGPKIILIQQLIDWLKEHEEKTKMKGFSLLIEELWWDHVINNENKKSKDKLEATEIKYLEDMFERAMCATICNKNLCVTVVHHIFSYLDIKGPKDPSAHSKLKKYVPKIIKIFEAIPDISNYIKYLSHDIFVKTLNEITIPKWVNEKLVNAPENIPRFEEMCRKHSKKYNYSTLSKKFNLSDFSKTLRYNHICKIIQKDPELDNDDFSESMLFGGDGEGLKEIKPFKNNNNKVDMIIDLPNIIRLTKPKDEDWNELERQERKRLSMESCELLIEFINNSKDVYYIHTTPETCSHFNKEVNQIQKNTDAIFLYYYFSKKIDEDYFFLKYALVNNIDIITKDKFKNYKSKLPLKICDAIKSRLQEPRLNKLRKIELKKNKK